MTGREFRTLFIQFNAEYFKNQLPEYHLRSVDGIRKGMRFSGFCIRYKRVICISRTLPRAEAVSTLLHEMAHAAVSEKRGKHGILWEAEMIRLRRAGAPLINEDRWLLNVDCVGTRRQFTETCINVLIGAPTPPVFERVIRLFISKYGGPDSTGAFLKQYSWAQRVYLNAVEKSQYERARVAAMKNKSVVG